MEDGHPSKIETDLWFLRLPEIRSSTHIFKIGGVNHYLKETPLGLFFKHPLQKKEIYPLIRLISNQTWQWKSPIYRWLIVPLKTHFQGFPPWSIAGEWLPTIQLSTMMESRSTSRMLKRGFGSKLTGGGIQMINRIKYRKLQGFLIGPCSHKCVHLRSCITSSQENLGPRDPGTVSRGTHHLSNGWLDSPMKTQCNA